MTGEQPPAAPFRSRFGASHRTTSGSEWPALAAILAALIGSRLCHVGILWPDGDYQLAAAIQMLKGSVPYRDFWFDKPPLTPLLHVLFGARPGVPLLLASACYLFVACVLALVIGKKLWSRREGLLAAGLLAFYLVFYLPAAVIPIPVDLAMIVPHLAAVACLAGGMPLAAGAAAGLALFFNVKGLLVLCVCLLWLPGSWKKIMSGFLGVVATGVAVLGLAGALRGYWEQVWVWGVAYAGSSPEAHPLANGLTRTANWVGFHLLAVLATVFFFARERSRLGREAWVWLVVSAAGVCLGLRFLPRYYFQVLPVVVVFGARGLVLAAEKRRRLALAAAGLLLLVPLVRFGPRYVMLASDLALGRAHNWADVALDQDSHAVANILNQRARPEDTLLVWGYRPAVLVYTRMKAGSRFLDCQPLTGVPAERHFTVSTPVTPALAIVNRVELMRSSPTYIVDALGFANPRLAIDQFHDLLPWLAYYDLVGRTPMSLIYQRRHSPDAAGVLARR